MKSFESMLANKNVFSSMGRVDLQCEIASSETEKASCLSDITNFVQLEYFGSEHGLSYKKCCETQSYDKTKIVCRHFYC